MSAQNDLRQAIELMQDGDVQAAVALLNRLIAEAQLDDKGRAAAYAWLAEAREDRAYKIRCLERALEQDPGNQQIRQGLQQLKAARPQPRQLPPLASERRRPDRVETPPVLGIAGGLNGPASGFCVNSAGLIATTSYAIGSAARVTVTLAAERQMAGTVISRFPTHDVALIEAPLAPLREPTSAPPSMVTQHSAFTALAYGGARLRGAIARLNTQGARQWLRTTIPPEQMPDAGGNPLYDEKGQLLGMLTRNVDGGGNALAIKIVDVARLADEVQRDRRLLPESSYCASCGSLSRARLFGGAHCETCGAAQAAKPGAALPVQSSKLAALYGEGAGSPCAHCGARIGSYAGCCLRCGHALASSRETGN